MKIIAQKSKYHRFGFYYDYAPDIVEFCRSLKEAFSWQRFNYDTTSGEKRWVFSDSFLVTVIKEAFPNIEIDPIVWEIVKHEQKIVEDANTRGHEIEKIKQKTDSNISINGIKGELYPYQKVGVEFLIASGGRAIISDSPGCGKSVQALAFAQIKKFNRILIVCPASVKFAWVNEIKKWTKMSSMIIDSKTKLHEIDGSIQYWVINYDILKRHFPQLSKIKFDLIIGDEAHFCKSIRSQRGKVFRQLSRNIPHIVLLSGTPLLSRPIELFSLLNILDPAQWNNYYDYARVFCAAKQTRFGLDVSGISNAEELHRRIRGYFLRRTKEDVLKDLPPKNRIEVPVEIEKSIARKYEIAESNFVSYMKQYSGKQPPEIAKTLQAEKLSQLNVLRMLNAVGKIPTAEEIIESIIESDEKIIVFCSFVEPLKKLHEKYKSKSVILTGETPVGERGNIINSFQNDDNVKIFFGGIKSAGVGITLTASSNVLFLDFPWNPADSLQAEDRAHRISQKAESVNIYQLYADGTIDDDLRKILQKKQGIFDAVIDGKFNENIAKDAIDAVTQGILKKYK